jgi:cold shock CspA family protein
VRSSLKRSIRDFGSIQRDDGEPDLFIHISGLADFRSGLEQGARVEFEIGTDARKGKPCAINVKSYLGGFKDGNQGNNFIR